MRTALTVLICLAVAIIRPSQQANPGSTDKGWHFILNFALIGFLVAMLAGCCMVFNAPNVITNLMLSVSPGLWFFLQRVLGSVGFANYHIAVWFSITVAAIANGMMYALVGAVIAGLRWMWKHRDTAK